MAGDSRFDAIAAARRPSLASPCQAARNPAGRPRRAERMTRGVNSWAWQMRGHLGSFQRTAFPLSQVNGPVRSGLNSTVNPSLPRDRAPPGLGTPSEITTKGKGQRDCAVRVLFEAANHGQSEGFGAPSEAPSAPWPPRRSPGRRLRPRDQRRSADRLRALARGPACPSGQGNRHRAPPLAPRRLDPLYSVDLMCDANLRDYYTRFDMVPLPGMGLRNPGALGATRPHE